MRRYSRFKICKTNFHFFFYSCRLENFKRPKWNILKEKIKFVKKLNKNNFSASKNCLSCFYVIPSIFKSFKYHSGFTSKKTIAYSKVSNIKINKKLNSLNFDFLFL